MRRYEIGLKREGWRFRTGRALVPFPSMVGYVCMYVGDTAQTPIYEPLPRSVMTRQTGEGLSLSA